MICVFGVPYAIQYLPNWVSLSLAALIGVLIWGVGIYSMTYLLGFVDTTK